MVDICLILLRSYHIIFTTRRVQRHLLSRSMNDSLLGSDVHVYCRVEDGCRCTTYVLSIWTAGRRRAGGFAK